MRIAVAGATGRVGHHVVEVLAARGHEVVPMSRKSGVDLVTGKGLAAALDGAECIVDAANGPPDQRAATEFFTAAARNLQEVGAHAGARRIVVVSILSVDRFAGGYMAAKWAHEQALRAGRIPVQVLRAAQFHEFVGQLVDWGRKGDVSYVPRIRTQLVAAKTVAEEVARLATDGAGRASSGAPFLEIGGPREELVAEAAKRLVARRGDAIRIEEAVGDPADPDQRLYATGAFLPAPGAMHAGPSFDEWLEATYSAPPERKADRSFGIAAGEAR
jgi:uncharacterized protein YbjT (DUF2867 family)